jgi:ribosome maturation factor RimP
VSLEDCESINDAFLEAFDRDEHDYSLTVTSAGLDQPFKVPAQFAKATGSTVEVRLKGGMKLVGVLTGADEEGICLRYTVKEVPEGKKKKVAVEHEDRFSFERINSVMPHITFDK